MSAKETARKIHNWMLGGVHADIANCELCDQIAELLAVESRAPAPPIERFGDWCDMKGIEPTMGQVDAFVREQVRAATPQVTPTPAKTRRQYVYDWMSLPTHRKVEKLRELGLFEEGDYAIPGDEQDLVWIKRAKEKGLAEKLLSIEGTSEQASPTPDTTPDKKGSN